MMGVSGARARVHTRGMAQGTAAAPAGHTHHSWASSILPAENDKALQGDRRWASTEINKNRHSGIVNSGRSPNVIPTKKQK